MITGTPFPQELETNKDVAVYRNYLQRKAQEPKSTYSSFIMPTLGMAAVGGLVMHKLRKPVITGVLAGAAGPLGFGYALKRIDDTMIDFANTAKDLPDERLDDMLGQEQVTISNRPAALKDAIRRSQIFSKTAGAKLKTATKILAATILGTGAIVAGSVAVSKKLNPHRWPEIDPITAIKMKPVPMVRTS